VEVNVRRCCWLFRHRPQVFLGAVVGQWRLSLDNAIDLHLPLFVGMQTFDRLDKT
jgi:hypothetical protein